MVDNGAMNSIPRLDHPALEELIRRALAEDMGDAGDITSKRTVRMDQPAKAHIIAKSTGVMAGGPVAGAVFNLVDKTLSVEWTCPEGATLEPGMRIARIEGRARAILAGERVALNFLQHLCGVATLTSQFVSICSKHSVKVLCTRKTLPGLRSLQRYAVAIGGGYMHRAGLYDAILIKTNHEKLAGGITAAVHRTKANPNLAAEVEVSSLGELEEAMEAGADSILFDNAELPEIKEAVKITRGKISLEVSGGVTLKNVGGIARLKPDAISIGALTHSAPAIDLALHIDA